VEAATKSRTVQDWHHPIGNEELRRINRCRSDRLCTVSGRYHPISLSNEKQLKDGHDVALVVNQQDDAHGHRCFYGALADSNDHSNCSLGRYGT
jgi:hypothetical protein